MKENIREGQEEVGTMRLLSLALTIKRTSIRVVHTLVACLACLHALTFTILAPSRRDDPVTPLLNQVCSFAKMPLTHGVGLDPRLGSRCLMVDHTLIGSSIYAARCFLHVYVPVKGLAADRMVFKGASYPRPLSVLAWPAVDIPSDGA
eukprot:scaffold254913_cov35-Tisochrysis_lutea.AAC.4